MVTDTFICIMGILTVFIGLGCMILICVIMSAIVGKAVKEKPKYEQAAVVNESNDDEISNRQEMLAAVCAAIAEESGTDISALRVHSFKKIN